MRTYPIVSAVIVKATQMSEALHTALVFIADYAPTDRDKNSMIVDLESLKRYIDELKDEPPKIIKYYLPVYWASYLINNDPSGLNDGEQIEIDAYIEAEVEKNGYSSMVAVDVSESWFAKANDANTLGGDVAQYTFCVGSVRDESKKLYDSLYEQKAEFFILVNDKEVPR